MSTGEAAKGETLVCGIRSQGTKEKEMFLSCPPAGTFSRAVHGLPSAVGGLLLVLYRKMS